jgi:hypothetical protein
MNAIFRSASSFNQAIGEWNTTAVTTTYTMPYAASSFDQAIGIGNTAAFTALNAMFQSASRLNQTTEANDGESNSLHSKG